MERVLVIGAGLAGLTCARRLKGAGWEVTVVDKGRGVGGRMSTRRGDGGQFDHGAQFFTAEDPEFQEVVAGWVEAGIAGAWAPRLGRWKEGALVAESDDKVRYVGTPTMNAVLRPWAEALGVQFGVRVTQLVEEGDDWVAEVEEGESLGPFPKVVVAIPAEQAAVVTEELPPVSAYADAVHMAPCVAAMVRFAGPVDCGFDAVFGDGSAVAWAAWDGSKPGRDGAATWVLHGSPEWSEAKLEDDPEASARALLEEFGGWVGGLPEVEHVAGHRWRYARVDGPLGRPWVTSGGVLACGDWCLAPKLEAAYVSGREAAQAVLDGRV